MAKKILIVEDEKSIRDALRGRLKPEGFSILEAGDGEEGLAIALDKKPDIILLDIIMPKMDGMTMLNKLREGKDDYGKSVPIIILTNLSDAQSIVDASQKDVRDYLVKSNWKLKDIVKKVMEKLA